MTTPQSVVETLWARIRAHTGDILDAITDRHGEVEDMVQEVQDIRDSGAVPLNAVGLPQLNPAVRSTVEGLPTALAGKADLVDGHVPTSQIPAVALTKPESVTSRAAMLALVAQEGDVAIITTGDDKGSYMLGDGPSSSFESWHLLAVSEDAPVQSVNGQVGTIVLGPEDIEAAPDDHDHTLTDITDWPGSSPEVTGQEGKLVQRDSGGRFYVTSPEFDYQPTPKKYVDDSLAGKSDDGHTHTTAQVTGLDSALNGKAPSHQEVTGDWPTSGTPGVIYWKAE